MHKYSDDITPPVRTKKRNQITALEYSSLEREEHIICFNPQGNNKKFLCCACNTSLHSYNKCLSHIDTDEHELHADARSLKVESYTCRKCFPPGSIEGITKLVVSESRGNRLTPTHRDERKLVCKRLQKVLREAGLRDINASLYGSSETLLGFEDSDVNIALTMDTFNNINEKVCKDVKDDESLFGYCTEVVQKCKKFKDYETYFERRNPEFRFTDIESGLRCSFNMYSDRAFASMDLIASYLACDERVEDLFMALRRWAKVCGIDRRNMGGIPAYNVMLLTLHFLQQTDPPVVPIIRVEVEDIQEGIIVDRQKEMEFGIHEEDVSTWESSNVSSLGELWLDFLSYYVAVFSRKALVVNIRQKTPMARKHKEWGSRRFAIEDPFNLRDNKGKESSSAVIGYFLECLDTSYHHFAPFCSHHRPGSKKQKNDDAAQKQNSSERSAPPSQTDAEELSPRKDGHMEHVKDDRTSEGENIKHSPIVSTAGDTYNDVPIDDADISNSDHISEKDDHSSDTDDSDDVIIESEEVVMKRKSTIEIEAEIRESMEDVVIETNPPDMAQDISSDFVKVGEPSSSISSAEELVPSEGSDSSSLGSFVKVLGKPGKSDSEMNTSDEICPIEMNNDVVIITSDDVIQEGDQEIVGFKENDTSDVSKPVCIHNSTGMGDHVNVLDVATTAPDVVTTVPDDVITVPDDVITVPVIATTVPKDVATVPDVATILHEPYNDSEVSSNATVVSNHTKIQDVSKLIDQVDSLQLDSASNSLKVEHDAESTNKELFLADETLTESKCITNKENRERCPRIVEGKTRIVDDRVMGMDELNTSGLSIGVELDGEQPVIDDPTKNILESGSVIDNSCKPTISDPKTDVIVDSNIVDSTNSTVKRDSSCGARKTVLESDSKTGSCSRFDIVVKSPSNKDECLGDSPKTPNNKTPNNKTPNNKNTIKNSNDTDRIKQFSNQPTKPSPDKKTKKKKNIQSNAQTPKGVEIREKQNAIPVFKFSRESLAPKRSVPLYCCECSRDGHTIIDCPNARCILSELKIPSAEYIKVLDSVCVGVMQSTVLMPKEFDLRFQLVNQLQDYLQKNSYEASRLTLFGSSVNGFGSSGSDMDICLRLRTPDPPRGMDAVDVVKKVERALQKHPAFMKVYSIKTAKVPIVKFCVNALDHVGKKASKSRILEGDISFYNSLAIHNSNMLSAYATIDYRVRTLGYCLKHFAKTCDIGDASKGSLSSYAYILLLLYYLQRCDPPVIPVLQEMYPADNKKPELIVDNWNVWFYNDDVGYNNVGDFSAPAIPKKHWKGKNKQSVGELFIGFFRYFLEEFDFRKEVVSMKQTMKLYKYQKKWLQAILAIEDPFNLDHNLGRGVTRNMFHYIKQCFINARDHFGNPDHKFSQTKNVMMLARNLFFNAEYLITDDVPQDRLCRRCGRIGHIAANCAEKVALDRDRRRNNSENNENSDTRRERFNKRRRQDQIKNGTTEVIMDCFQCGKIGHKKADCPDLNNSRQNKANSKKQSNRYKDGDSQRHHTPAKPNHSGTPKHPGAPLHLRNSHHSGTSNHSRTPNKVNQPKQKPMINFISQTQNVGVPLERNAVNLPDVQSFIDYLGEEEKALSSNRSSAKKKCTKQQPTPPQTTLRYASDLESQSHESRRQANAQHSQPYAASNLYRSQRDRGVEKLPRTTRGEEQHQTSRSPVKKPSEDTTKPSKDKQIKCSSCKKTGHRKNNCPSGIRKRTDNS